MHRPLEASMGKYLRWVLVGPLFIDAYDEDGFGDPCGYGYDFGDGEYGDGAGGGDSSIDFDDEYGFGRGYDYGLGHGDYYGYDADRGGVYL